jgi:hypothetical protein
MAKQRYVLVGEGDNGISSHDWRKPISDYPALLSIHSECESAGLGFPVDGLSDYLLRQGLIKNRLGHEAAYDLQTLLEALLQERLDVQRTRYDHDMPGASGVYYKAYLDTSRMDQVSAILDAVDEFLLDWQESPSVSSALRGASASLQDSRRTVAQAKESSEQSHLERIQRDQRVWEDELYQQIQSELTRNSLKAFARLHFLVFNGKVLFLDRQGWWHSIKGDPHKVARSLMESGVPLIRVAVKYSNKGWIPHFARTQAEERGLGWFDKTIELDGGSSEVNDLIEKSRDCLDP